MSSPLSGLKLIDLSEDISAAFCSRLFALGGATVIKVESPKGDPTRRFGPYPDGKPHLEHGWLFAYLNAGKLGASLDFMTATGRDVLLRLVRWADVVVEGFPPRHLPSIGLGYEVLRQTKPGIVLTSITPFGQTGPYRDYRATEIGLHAISGEMSLAGGRDLPLKKGGNVAQCLGGQHGFIASMAALFQGDGRHVDVSVSEALTTIIGGPLHEQSFSNGGPAPGRRDNGLGWPYGVRECRDGYVMVFTSYGNVWWPEFARMISGDESIEVSSSPPTPGEEQDRWDALLDEWLKARTRTEVVDETQRRGLAFGYVATAPDLLASPQLAHRRFFHDVSLPGGPTVKLGGLPFLVDGERLPVSLGPRHGEHNVRVFCDILGLTRRELVALSASGVV